MHTVDRRDPAGTVWLCRPGIADNPCTRGLGITSVDAEGKRTTREPSRRSSKGFDCFYLYPTASTENGVNSDLKVQPAEEDIAYAQVAQFSRVCSVWAPMYRQITVAALHGGGGESKGNPGEVAYESVVHAWDDFITHYDKGTPIVFISHSQGSVMLVQLLRQYVDTDPTLVHRTVTAIIAGGNVTVPPGKTVGAAFRNLPLCTSPTTVHCVIAYSSFPSEPPPDSMFGIPGQGISLNWGQTRTTGVQVACVNPADLSGGTADAAMIYPTPAPLPMSSMEPSPDDTTTFVSYPGHYSATCTNEGNATWLQVTDQAGSGDTRPTLQEVGGPSWGYHFDDINIFLGDLVNDVAGEEAAYAR